MGGSCSRTASQVSPRASPRVKLGQDTSLPYHSPRASVRYRVVRQPAVFRALAVDPDQHVQGSSTSQFRVRMPDHLILPTEKPSPSPPPIIAAISHVSVPVSTDLQNWVNTTDESQCTELLVELECYRDELPPPASQCWDQSQ